MRPTSIRAIWSPEKQEYPASHYAQKTYLTLEFLARTYGIQATWEDAESGSAVDNSEQVSACLAQGVNRTDTTGEVITELGFICTFLCGPLTATFTVGGTVAEAPGVILVRPPDAPETTPQLAENLIGFLASAWAPDSAAWTDTDVLRLNRDLGYGTAPSPGALVWVNESVQDPLVGGEPMLNGTLHRLADRPHDVTADILHAAHRHPLR